MVCKEQNVAGLASQGAADFFERIKIDSDGLAFFQSPQSSMTHASLLRQPVEAALFLGQQFVEPGDNHNRALILTTSEIYCRPEIHPILSTYPVLTNLQLTHA